MAAINLVFKRSVDMTK